MECSREDKDECTAVSYGEDNEGFECYCKTDYCNGSARLRWTPALAVMLVLALAFY